MVYLCLIFLIAVFGLFRWRSDRARDFYQFWVVGQAIQFMDLTNIYSDQDRQRIGEYFLKLALKQRASIPHIKAALERRVIEPAGSPFLYSIFLLFSTGQYDFDYEVFRILSSIAYILSIVFICHMLKVPRLLTVAFILFFTEFFDPFRRDMLEGNVNQVQFGIITLILWLRSRKGKNWNEIAAAAILGLLIMFKPNLALLFIFLLMGTLFMKSIRPALLLTGGVGLGIGFGFGLPLLLFGKVCNWAQWWRSFPQMVLIEKYMKRSFLGILFGTGDAAPYYFLMFFLVICPFLIILISKIIAKTHEQSESKIGRSLEFDFSLDLLMIGFGVCVYLLSSPLVHFHYFTLIVPFLLFVLRPSRRTYSCLPKDELKRILFGCIIFLLFDIRVYRSGYPGTGIFLTYWPFSYASIFFLYGWGIFQLMRLVKADSPLAH